MDEIDNCESPEEINNFLNHIQLMVAYVNKYFNPDDFSQSVKNEINI